MLKKVNMCSLETCFTDENDGDAVLFLHGWGSSRQSFVPIMRYIEGRKICLDLWGFGNSEVPHQAWSVYDYAKAVISLMQELGVERFSVVGHSFGGRVAIILASEFPDKINKIVLISSAGLRRKNIMRSIKISSYKLCKRLCKRKILPQKILEKFGSRDLKELSAEMKNTFLRIINEELSPYAKRIKVPTLLLWGRCDNETPLWMFRRYSRLIKGCNGKIINGCGHFGHEEKPYNYALEIKSFLEEK